MRTLRTFVALGLLSLALIACTVEHDGDRWSSEDAAVGDPDAWPPQPEDESAFELSDNLLALNYYVILDGSGSMRDSDCSGNQNKMGAAKSALASFAESIPGEANLGLLAFDERGIQEWLRLGTANRDSFINFVNQTKAQGGTPLRRAITQGYMQLTKQAQTQLGYGEYHLVIVTDGEASDGQDPTRIVNRILGESPVVIHTIGFCIGARHTLNRKGQTLYRAADSPEELRQGLEAVLAEAPSFTQATF